VILFGSRARGDFKKTSDIDIAVEGGNFARFALDVEEETSTLLEFDIVDMERDMQEELRKSIETEGKVIYEKI
jgi:predicted nucleotidyltransferase